MSSTTAQHPIIFPFSPSPVFAAGYPRQRQAHSFQKPQEGSLGVGAALYTGGLQTPPADDNMNMAYPNPILSNTYDSHVALARQPLNGLAQPARNGVGLCDALTQFPRISQLQQPQQQQPPPLPQQQQQQPIYQQAIQPPSTLVPQPHSASSRHSTRPSTPSSTCSNRHSDGSSSKADSTMVLHSLKLPLCISPNGGNLDEFAARMTCFFWFETMDTIRAAEHIKERRPSEHVPTLSKHTEPCPAYLKWVHNILSTTQVTQNVILLALLFVYRLKKTNPKVNGNPGSEYRLLTVALMLSNKFLDDNTYTNKTWAEVSGISVKEIHVMEVEFLSNMRYGLLASKEQWQEWLKKLACYHDYCERAKMEDRLRQVPPMPAHMPSPTHRFSSPLPSPTSILPPNMQATSTPMLAYSPTSALSNGNFPQNWNPSYHPTPTVSPLAARPSQGLARKRSLEGGDLVAPIPKRVPRQPAHMPSTTSGDPSRLPIPHLTLDTSQAVQPVVPPPQSTYPAQSSVSLPPIGAGMRAMSTVYPTVTTTWAPQGAILATCGPQTPSYAAPTNFGTPSKRHSPNSLTTFASSPLTEPFGAHTPISNSPSIYLQQRASPYKPVRRVNTLLYPPPSMPLSEYHLGSSQMHYQPLGRRNDLRSGIVPEFLPPSFIGTRPTSQTSPHHPYQGGL